MKTSSVVGAAVVALVFTGAGASVTRDTVFTIVPQHFARLAGTGVYCKNRQFVNDLPSFLCGRFAANGKREHGTYALELRANGRVAVGLPPKFQALAQFPQIPGWLPGVVSAVAPGSVKSIKPGQYARLGSRTVFGTSNTYCQAYIDSRTHKPAFDCGTFGTNYHVGGSYSAVIDEGGVTVAHWDASGRHSHAVGTYLNP